MAWKALLLLVPFPNFSILLQVMSEGKDSEHLCFVCLHMVCGTAAKQPGTERTEIGKTNNRAIKGDLIFVLNSGQLWVKLPYPSLWAAGGLLIL